MRTEQPLRSSFSSLHNAGNSDCLASTGFLSESLGTTWRSRKLYKILGILITQAIQSQKMSQMVTCPSDSSHPREMPIMGMGDFIKHLSPGGNVHSGTAPHYVIPPSAPATPPPELACSLVGRTGWCLGGSRTDGPAFTPLPTLTLCASSRPRFLICKEDQYWYLLQGWRGGGFHLF